MMDGLMQKITLHLLVCAVLLGLTTYIGYEFLESIDRTQEIRMQETLRQ